MICKECLRDVPEINVFPADLLNDCKDTCAHVRDNGGHCAQGAYPYTDSDDRQSVWDTEACWDLGPDPDPEPITDFANHCGAV